MIHLLATLSHWALMLGAALALSLIVVCVIGSLVCGDFETFWDNLL